MSHSQISEMKDNHQAASPTAQGVPIYFWFSEILILFWGMKILWIFFGGGGGSSRNWTIFGGLWSFFKVKVQNQGYFCIFGGCQNFKYFLGCSKFLIFLG